jgi:hypothetical protein
MIANRMMQPAQYECGGLIERLWVESVRTLGQVMWQQLTDWTWCGTIGHQSAHFRMHAAVLRQLAPSHTFGVVEVVGDDGVPFKGLRVQRTRAWRGCVASRTTGGATPDWSASRQRSTQRHQRSPGLRPGKPHSGLGVDRSLPRDPCECQKLLRHLCTDDVKPRILRTGVAAAVSVEAGDGSRAARNQRRPEYIVRLSCHVTVPRSSFMQCRRTGTATAADPDRDMARCVAGSPTRRYAKLPGRWSGSMDGRVIRIVTSVSATALSRWLQSDSSRCPMLPIPEAIRVRHLSRIDHEPASSQLIVECLKIELRMIGVDVRGDDAALVFGGHVRSETHAAHPVREDAMAATIPIAATLDAALGIQCIEGFAEREQGMGRRRETELTLLLETLPLGKQVQADRPGAISRGQQRVASADHEGETRYALDALVRRGDDEVDARIMSIQRVCTECGSSSRRSSPSRTVARRSRSPRRRS